MTGDGSAPLMASPAARGKRRRVLPAVTAFSRLILASDWRTSRCMRDEADILAANAAYYSAFSSADFPAMSRIWADDELSCIHPGWPALFGRRAVMESYRQILDNPAQQRIEPRNPTVIVTGEEARVICVEFVGGAALAATNLFRHIDGAWRMTHHQASPIAALVEEPPEAPSSTRLN